jgi:hypothetical protein
VKPPETSSVFRPASRSAARNVSTPGFSRSVCSQISALHEIWEQTLRLNPGVETFLAALRDAAAQAFLEVGDLAAHRGLGDGRHLGLEPGRRGDLVDAFDVDQRRIHVERRQAEVGEPQRGNEAADDEAARKVFEAHGMSAVGTRRF